MHGVVHIAFAHIPKFGIQLHGHIQVQSRLEMEMKQLQLRRKGNRFEDCHSDICEEHNYQ